MNNSSHSHSLCFLSSVPRLLKLFILYIEILISDIPVEFEKKLVINKYMASENLMVASLFYICCQLDNLGRTFTFSLASFDGVVVSHNALSGGVTPRLLECLVNLGN
jgi:hypothetical protein